MNESNDSRPALDLSEKTKVRLPLNIWLGIVVTLGTAAGGYFVLRADVARHSVDIVELKQDARQTRELLIRIDANVTALKEARKND